MWSAVQPNCLVCQGFKDLVAWGQSDSVHRICGEFCGKLEHGWSKHRTHE